MARPAGIHADTSAVKRHISAAASSPHGVITRYMLTFSPLPSKKPKESRRHHSVIPIPAHPASIPSGVPMAQSTGQSVQPLKYNAHEYIEAHGYDTYDYGFRGYYATIGRFTSIDPLCERTPWQSVRSLTDIENELYISETEPQNIMSTRIITIP